MTENLVRDRVAEIGDFGEGDLLVALLPNQNYFISHKNLCVADVDHELVHADVAGDGEAAAADEDAAAVGEGAAVAVAVANGDGDDAGLFLGDVGVVVADAEAGADDFEVRDLRFEGEARGDLELRGVAVDHKAGADHVEVGIGVVEDAA